MRSQTHSVVRTSYKNAHDIENVYSAATEDKEVSEVQAADHMWARQRKWLPLLGPAGSLGLIQLLRQLVPGAAQQHTADERVVLALIVGAACTVQLASLLPQAHAAQPAAIEALLTLVTALVDCDATNSLQPQSDSMRGACQLARATGASVGILQLLTYLSEQCHPVLAWLQVQATTFVALDHCTVWMRTIKHMSALNAAHYLR